MTLRRELILQRLEEILNEVPNIKSMWRNVAALADHQRPALYLFDGDETNAMPDQSTNRGRGPIKGYPYILSMTPQIHIALENRYPGNLGVGTDLNIYLEDVRRRVEYDNNLIELVSEIGSIQYLGFTSDLGVDRPMIGQYNTSWRLTYPGKIDPPSG